MKITDIDVNFKPVVLPDNVEIEYYNCLEKPFKVFGVLKDDVRFSRIPHDIAKEISHGVEWASQGTSGGRICFKTNSRYVAITAKMGQIVQLGHLTTVGSAGFDLYVKDEFRAAFIPDYDVCDGFNRIADLEDNTWKDVTINLPLYSEVLEIYIGVEKWASVEEYTPYIDMDPIVYYGSSISHGGCASRPGNIYPAEIARQTNIDFINLGFAGSALGETRMAEYIADLPMSIFVMAYDHNSTKIDHLKSTHENFFKIVRAKNPDLPIIIVSRPDFKQEIDIERRDVVYSTYINAHRNGDKNVYYIDGSRIFGSVPRSYCTVDRTHPNDLGFYCMAQHIGKMIQDILRKL